MDTAVAAVFLVSLTLILVTGLVGFLALCGAWYMTHRPVDVPIPFDLMSKRTGWVDKVRGMAPPPVAPVESEVVIHPVVEDYIREESESWARDDLRRRAKSLYAEHPAWEWVLTQLRKYNEGAITPDPDAINPASVGVSVE